jgi:inner membrane protein involved in colicin E2 resistance
MEEQEKKPYKPSAIKLCSIALLSLLLLIPLVMVQNTIEDRGETKNNVELEISNSSASQQQIA